MAAEIFLPGLQMAVFSLCPHVTFFFPCVQEERALSGVSSLLTGAPILIRLGLHPVSSFDFNYLNQGPVSKYSHIWS